MIKWLDDHAGILSALAIALTLMFESCNQYFDNLGPSKISVGIGNTVELNQKPYIGLNVILRNSGASEGYITRGALMYDTTELKLVMEALERATWTYTEPRVETPPKFAFFAPIILGRDESLGASLWFEVNTTSKLFDSPGRKTLTLRLYGHDDSSPAVATTFYINLSKTNLADIYDPGNSEATLPVSVIYGS